MKGKVLATLSVVAVLLLTASFETAMNSSRAIAVAWLLASLLILVTAMIYLAWTVIDTMRRPQFLQARFDTLFWIAFLALPFLLWLVFAVGWNLKDLFGP